MGVFVWRKQGSRKGSKTSRKQSKQSKAKKARQGSKEAKGREQKGRNRSVGRAEGRADGQKGRTLRFARYTDGRQSFTQSGRAEGNPLLRKGGKGRADRLAEKGARKQAKARKGGRKLGKVP